MRRGPVRDLHPGDDHRGALLLEKRPALDPARGPRGASRQSLPVHRLSEDHRRRADRRARQRAMISRIPVTSASTLTEAYSVLAARTPGLRVLAGGTDLMVQVNARLGLDTIRHVLDIWSLRELRGIERREGKLSIGALTTYSELIGSPLVREFFPAI